MLENTFVHFKRVGPKSESNFWSDGLLCWSDVVGDHDSGLAKQAEVSIERLEARDSAYFHERLPTRERWRAYPEFVSDAAFLDIETTGMSAEQSYVTVVGVLDCDGYTAYVRGDNLDELPRALERYELVVTYNGASFDLPYLESYFETEAERGLFGDMLHIDLRHPLRRAGYKGGLKAIEQTTGLGRSSALATLRGSGAVTLWHMADTGEPGALETLIRYNAEDVASLPRLAALAFDELSAELPINVPFAPRLPVFDTSCLPYDQELVNYVSRYG